jgi:ribose transport system ATP-binding protein
MGLADRVTVLRDGRHVVTAPIRDMSRSRLIAAMVGRDTIAAPAAAPAAGPVVLAVEGLTLDVAGRHGWRRVLHGIDFELRAGEVLGIGGLLGSGRTEILETLFGAGAGRVGGTIRLDGAAVRVGSPRAARRLGIALVTEDRKAKGLHLAASIRDNVALPSLGRLARFGIRSAVGEARVAESAVARLGVRCSGIEQVAATLSGGNQQKVVIGKWLETGPRVLLLDEPTRGIDVGAKQEIYGLIRTLAGDGLAIVMVSSELPELLLLADRILVMSEGRKAGELARAAANEEAIMHLAAPASPVRAAS